MSSPEIFFEGSYPNYCTSELHTFSFSGEAWAWGFKVQLYHRYTITISLPNAEQHFFIIHSSALVCCAHKQMICSSDAVRMTSSISKLHKAANQFARVSSSSPDPSKSAGPLHVLSRKPGAGREPDQDLHFHGFS